MKKIFSVIMLVLFLAGNSVIIAQPTVISYKPVYTVNELIIIRFYNDPGNELDWVGLYYAGAPSSPAIDWLYVGGSKSPHRSAPDGSLLFALSDTGSFEARLFFNNGYTLLAQTGFGVRASPPSATSDKIVYRPGEPIFINFSNGPGFPADWVGLYEAGAPSTPSIGWYYVNGTTTPGAPLYNGTVEFSGGLSNTGTYEARYFLDNGYSLVGKTTFIITNTPPSLNTDKSIYGVGQPIAINFTNGPGNPTDWIGLYHAGAPPSPYIDWLYVNGTKTAGSALQNGTVTFSGGLNNGGSYEARFYLNDEYTLLYDTTFTIALPQFTEVPNSFPGLVDPSIYWGDYDNDGDPDVVVTGFGIALKCVVFRNNRDGTFTAIADLENFSQGSAVWGDYDNDGYIDILLSGSTHNPYGVSKIFKNNGLGAFIEQTSIILPQLAASSAAWNDFNNDGYLDFVLAGNNGSGQLTYIFKNNGNGTFTQVVSLPGVESGDAAWGDYNNDGYSDLLLTGSTGQNKLPFTKLYKNNGDLTFIEANVILTPLTNSSAAWGDYNGDGFLDILICGFDGSSANTKLYSNNGNGTFSEQTSANLQNVTSGKVIWGDYNNDNVPDILITGSNNINPVTKIYTNNLNGTFSENTFTLLTQLYRSSAAFADYDADGDLDFLLIGTPNAISKEAKLYKNNNTVPNRVPRTPISLSASVNGNDVTFSWNWNWRTVDKPAPITLNFNLVIGTTPGSIDRLSPMSDISSGYRRIVKLGNSQSTSKIITLPDGIYYWSVQSIDGAFVGSPFQTVQTITVDSGRK